MGEGRLGCRSMGEEYFERERDPEGRAFAKI